MTQRRWGIARCIPQGTRLIAIHCVLFSTGSSGEMLESKIRITQHGMRCLVSVSTAKDERSKVLAVTLGTLVH